MACLRISRDARVGRGCWTWPEAAPKLAGPDAAAGREVVSPRLAPLPRTRRRSSTSPRAPREERDERPAESRRRVRWKVASFLGGGWWRGDRAEVWNGE